MSNNTPRPSRLICFSWLIFYLLKWVIWILGGMVVSLATAHMFVFFVYVGLQDFNDYPVVIGYFDYIGVPIFQKWVIGLAIPFFIIFLLFQISGVSSDYRDLRGECNRS